MIKIEEYVRRIFKDIPDSEQKESIVWEITTNLEEKVQTLVDDGKDKEDAINKAIIDFGDMDEIKKELLDDKPHKKDNSGIYLGYSIWGSLLLIALFIFMNLYYTPNTIWFVYPVFLVLWWPLTMFYIYLNKRKNKK